jgi:hypothetical protein
MKKMCVLSEVYSTKTVSVEVGRLPVAGEGGACDSTTLATLNTLPQVILHVSRLTPHTIALPIFP